MCSRADAISDAPLTTRPPMARWSRSAAPWPNTEAGRCGARRSTPPESRARCAWAQSFGASSAGSSTRRRSSNSPPGSNQIMIVERRDRGKAPFLRSRSPAACWPTRRWRCSQIADCISRRARGPAGDARHPRRQNRDGRGSRAVRDAGRLRQHHRLRHQFRLRAARAVDGYDFPGRHHQVSCNHQPGPAPSCLYADHRRRKHSPRMLCWFGASACCEACAPTQQVQPRKDVGSGRADARLSALAGRIHDHRRRVVWHVAVAAMERRAERLPFRHGHHRRADLRGAAG